MTATRTLVAGLALSTALGISCYSEQLPPPTYRYPCGSNAECSSEEVCRRGLCERPCTELEVLLALAVEADEQPCPFESGYAGCFNGACANTCELGGDYCPNGQSCVDVGIQASGGFGGSATDVGVCTFQCSDGDDDLCQPTEVCEEGTCTAIDCVGGDPCPDGYSCTSGSCAFDCSMGQTCPGGQACNPLLGICIPDCDPACPDGSACFFGVCGTACTTTDECDTGLACLFGVCVLESFEFPTGGDGGSTSSTSGGSTGMGDGSSGDPTTGDPTTGDPTTGGSTGMGYGPVDEEELR